MKSFLVIFAFFLAKAVCAAPSQDDSLINRISPNHVHKWELKVDKDGNTFLIDTNPLKEDPKAASKFNALEDVEFWLYTRKNPDNHQQLFLNNVETLRNSNFDPSLPVRVIIHGWNNNGNSDVNKLLKSAFLDTLNCNVIVVDWRKGANHLVYSVSRGRIDDVGFIVGVFIDFLIEQTNIPLSSFLITGHSLGGHTAGIAGKRVNGQVLKIVALDPAGPLFSFKNEEGRVHYTDAEYVEVIHTNTGILGFSDPIGDVDFYPNWGSGQPGCGIDPAGTCDHSRAFEFYAESIRSGGFSATRCKNYNEMTGTLGFGKKCTNTGSSHMGGEPLSTDKPHGVYYLETNKKQPFSKN